MADGYTLRIASNKFGLDKATLMQVADAIVRKTAADIVAEAQAVAPVRTGYLRNSIRMEIVGPGHARVSVGAEYGPFVEYGTRFMFGRPYFWPAANHQWDNFVQAFRDLQAAFR